MYSWGSSAHSSASSSSKHSMGNTTLREGGRGEVQGPSQLERLPRHSMGNTALRGEGREGKQMGGCLAEGISRSNHMATWQPLPCLEPPAVHAATAASGSSRPHSLQQHLLHVRLQRLPRVAERQRLRGREGAPQMAASERRPASMPAALASLAATGRPTHTQSKRHQVRARKPARRPKHRSVETPSWHSCAAHLGDVLQQQVDDARRQVAALHRRK